MSLFLFVAAGTLMLAHMLAIGLYLRRLKSREPVRGILGTPSLTLIRPVCGVDAFDEETLKSSFHQDYPDYDIIFCAQSADDPAVELVQRLISEHPKVPAQLLIGYDEITRNPKLNNVYKGWQASQKAWVCVTDSNLLLPPDYLSVVVGSWGPATGLVSSPPAGARPMDFGGHLECAFLNSNQAVLQFAADSLGPAYAQGKTLFFNRPLIELAGGIRALGQCMAEDVTATKIIRSFGREVTLTPLPFAQPIGARSLVQVWQRQLRWSRVRRDGFPLLFATEFLNGSVAPSVMLALAIHLSSGDWIWLIGFVALWYLPEILVSRLARWPMSVVDLCALVVRDLFIPLIWMATFLKRGFVWRGTNMSQTKPLSNRPIGFTVPAE